LQNQLPDAFTHNKKIVKSHIAIANTPAKIEVPVGQSINISTNESKAYKSVQMIRFLKREKHKEM
jgi:hypothetical protein